jgi:hypothetical protein
LERGEKTATERSGEMIVVGEKWFAARSEHVASVILPALDAYDSLYAA